jgi:uncharacterized delta-60 repeat protein
MLTIVLLLPLPAAGQEALEALAPLDSDEAVETLALAAPGDLDTSFSSDGKAFTDFRGGSYDRASALAIQPDGMLVVAGVSFNASDIADFALARYRPDGSLDPTFGSAGKVLTDFGSDSDDDAGALVIQPDGKLVVAGTSNGDFALARYLPNGALDPTFGSGGTVLTDVGSGSDDGAMALALQPDGKLVVAGRSDGDFALARYKPNGTLDTTFSGEGKVTTTFGDSSQATALILQPDGKLVAAGWFQVRDVSGFFLPPDIALARYRPNGTPDPTFSGDGKVLTAFRGGSRDQAFALAIQPHDGRLVIAGESDASGHSDFALARYHAITCGGVVVTRIGTNSNDTLIGTDGPDVIFGFGGNDLIDGLGGNDILCGGSGNDTLRGGSGDDILRGGPGTDTCHGEAHVSGDTAAECERVTGVL